MDTTNNSGQTPYDAVTTGIIDFIINLRISSLRFHVDYLADIQFLFQV